VNGRKRIPIYSNIFLLIGKGAMPMRLMDAALRYGRTTVIFSLKKVLRSSLIC